MTRRKLLRLVDVAELLGVSKQRADQLRRRAWFPVTQRRGHPWALLETRYRPRLGAAVGQERPWRKLSAN